MNSLQDFKHARDLLKGIIHSTNLIHSPFLSESCGNTVYLKPENLQVTGSFKIRGAYYKIAKQKEHLRGLIASSAGNHAQGVAYAAKCAGIPATIVMPLVTPLIKVNNTKKYGAQVLLHGDYYDEAFEFAYQRSIDENLQFIHPFNDLDIATGQGSIAYEILEDLPDTDIILVPVGGGGLAAGVSTLAKMLNPKVKVVGVEPVGAACLKYSLDNGKLSSLTHVETIADGVAVHTPGDILFPYLQKNLDGVITVADPEMIDAFLDVMENHKMVVENAGLLTISALKKLGVQNKRVVSVLSGGNMDVITMAGLVQHGLIERGRVFTFSLMLPDKPGELVKAATIIAAQRGNVIKLDHNQFVNINRNKGVELTVTLETNSKEHQQLIVDALTEAGYEPVIKQVIALY